jgi:hypothetical protein
VRGSHNKGTTPYGVPDGALNSKEGEKGEREIGGRKGGEGGWAF